MLLFRLDEDDFSDASDATEIKSLPDSGTTSRKSASMERRDEERRSPDGEGRSGTSSRPGGRETVSGAGPGPPSAEREARDEEKSDRGQRPTEYELERAEQRSGRGVVPGDSSRGEARSDGSRDDPSQRSTGRLGKRVVVEVGSGPREDVGSTPSEAREVGGTHDGPTRLQTRGGEGEERSLGAARGRRPEVSGERAVQAEFGVGEELLRVKLPNQAKSSRKKGRI